MNFPSFPIMSSFKNAEEMENFGGLTSKFSTNS